MNAKTILDHACSAYEEDLVLYYYGEGSLAERQRVEEHIGACTRCRKFVEDLRGLLPHMTQTTPMPASFWDGYYREMKQKLAAERERKTGWRGWFSAPAGWIVPAFGTAAIAVLAGVIVIGRGEWSARSTTSDAPIPQEILADGKQLEFFSSLDMLESLPKLEKLEGAKPAGVNTL